MKMLFTGTSALLALVVSLGACGASSESPRVRSAGEVATGQTTQPTTIETPSSSQRMFPSSTSTTSPHSSTVSRTSPPGTGTVPNLDSRAAKFMTLMSAQRSQWHGMTAYRLQLSKGSAWAIAGSPDRVVPMVLKDSAYSPTASLLFRSGPYVLFFPGELPEVFYTHLGPIPGMSLIDSDLYR